MELLASLLVGKPLNILFIALAFFAAYLSLRFTLFGNGKSSSPMLLSASAWAAYAAWEWLVKVKTPEADIRVDLLLIWPALALIMIWAMFRLFR
jgi:hypothetical protein